MLTLLQVVVQTNPPAKRIDPTMLTKFYVDRPVMLIDDNIDAIDVEKSPKANGATAHCNKLELLSAVVYVRTTIRDTNKQSQCFH